jgi:hypothetical protein
MPYVKTITELSAKFNRLITEASESGIMSLADVVEAFGYQDDIEYEGIYLFDDEVYDDEEEYDDQYADEEKSEKIVVNKNKYLNHQDLKLGKTYMIECADYVGDVKHLREPLAVVVFREGNPEMRDIVERYLAGDHSTWEFNDIPEVLYTGSNEIGPLHPMANIFEATDSQVRESSDKVMKYIAPCLNQYHSLSEMYSDEKVGCRNE